MRKVKKYSIWLSVSILVLIVLITAGFYVASNFIQKDSVKEKIHTLISEKVGGDVDYESMNLYFFHWPHIAIRNAEISIPEKVEGTFDQVLVYPKILPLLYGNVEISSVKFSRPIVSLNIPEKSEDEEPESAEGFSFNLYKDQLVMILDYLNSNWKGFDARIDYGKLTIKKADKDFLEFSNINAAIEFPNNTLNYRVHTYSNISQVINLKGSVDTKSYDARGSISLDRFKPHILLHYLFPDNKLVSESKIDIDLNYKTKAFDLFQGNLLVSNSKITLSKGKEEFQISGNKIDTDIHLDEDKALFNINTIDLFHPDVSASGVHKIDKKNSGIELTLYGTDINVKSSRDAVLFIAGGDRIVDLIFNIVRGGTVPKISLRASGDDFKDMWKTDNFEIKGNLIDGNIFIPYGDLDLTDVSGDAVIKDGKLTGTNLKAKYDNSKGYDGTFIIGIEGPIGPLHLDISVDGDGSEIPSIIEKFVDDPGFLYELSLIEDIKGRAIGKLKIGETKKSPLVGVYVSDLDIVGDYKRVPEPVSVKGNNFTFVDKSIDFQNLSVTIGNLSSPNISGSYDWKVDKKLSLRSKNTQVDLAILFPWLTSFETLKPHLRHIESLSGSAFLNFANFAGPVNNSEEWEISAEGHINNANVRLDELDREMLVSQTKIKSTSEEMSISNTTVDIEDSKMNIGAVLTNYLTDWLNFKMEFYGNMLPDEAKIFSDYFKVPKQLNYTSPVSISESNLVLHKKPNILPKNNDGINAITSETKSKVLDLNINVSAESLEWVDSEPDAAEEKIEAVEPSLENKNEGSPTTLSGKVQIKSDNFKFKGFDWDTVDAEVAFLGNKIDVNVSDANLCGIATPGVLEVTSPTLKLQFEPFTEQENLADAIKCLFDKAGIITGDFDLGGTVNSNSEIVDVMKSLEGELLLTSEGGRVSKYGGLARFFSALNFGEIFRGNTIDYEDEGFPYEFIKASAQIKEGQLIIKEAAMDGPSLKVVCDGSIDLVNDQLDLKVLVIPVLAVDSVIENIPLIGALLGKDVVSIPIKVTGDISDPEISQLSTHTIGAGLLGIVKQTLNIPVTLVKPLDSGKKRDNFDTDVSDTDESSEEIPED